MLLQFWKCGPFLKCDLNLKVISVKTFFNSHIPRIDMSFSLSHIKIQYQTQKKLSTLPQPHSQFYRFSCVFILHSISLQKEKKNYCTPSLPSIFSFTAPISLSCCFFFSPHRRPSGSVPKVQYSDVI